jgi:RND family efflux transporter MFP subunit
MSRQRRNRGAAPAKALSVLLGFAILAVGIGIAVWMVRTAPKAKPRQRPKRIPLVDVVTLRPTNVTARLDAMGEVIAADEAALQAEVSGRIEWVHPELEVGGVVTQGCPLVRIDARDYRLALRQREAALAGARSDRRIEAGRQDIASNEWALVGAQAAASGLDLDLALRRPQRQAAEAAVESAGAAVEQARIHLERTEIRSPFDAVVAEASADVGDRATPGAVLARLVAVDRFFVKASVRPSSIPRLALPESPRGRSEGAVIRSSAGGRRAGALLRLLPGLDPVGRMAQVLVEVPDPLGRNGQTTEGPALLLGDLVQLDLPGRAFEGVLRIPRTSLREGNRLWLLDAENKLRMPVVEILWGDRNAVYVANRFEAGARMVVSTLGAPIEGMPLAIEGSPTPDGPGGKPRRGQPGPAEGPAGKAMRK